MKSNPKPKKPPAAPSDEDVRRIEFQFRNVESDPERIARFLALERRAVVAVIKAHPEWIDDAIASAEVRDDVRAKRRAKRAALVELLCDEFDAAEVAEVRRVYAVRRRLQLKADAALDGAGTPGELRAIAGALPTLRETQQAQRLVTGRPTDRVETGGPAETAAAKMFERVEEWARGELAVGVTDPHAPTTGPILPGGGVPTPPGAAGDAGAS